jgi:hypothetical protein
VSQKSNNETNGARETSSALDDLLRDALALPREITPPRGMWSGIEARIQTKRRRVIALRRGVTGASMLLAAAAVALCIQSVNRGHQSRVPGPTASEEPDIEPVVAAADPPDLEDVMEQEAADIVPEEASYRVALAALGTTFDAQSKALPDKDRGAVDASLAALDAAIAVTRASLREHPDDADLRAELDAEYEQKIDAMNDVLEWTTRS